MTVFLLIAWWSANDNCPPTSVQVI